MNKFYQWVVGMLVMTVIFAAGMVVKQQSVRMDCVQHGHFDLMGDTYLCRPIGKLSKMKPWEPTASGAAE